jgi:hypothetical protein
MQDCQNGILPLPRVQACFLGQRVPSNCGPCYPRSVHPGTRWKSIHPGALSGFPLAREKTSQGSTPACPIFSDGSSTRSTRDRTCVITSTSYSSPMQHRSSPCVDIFLHDQSCRSESGAARCLSSLASLTLLVGKRLLDGKRCRWLPLLI